MIIAIDGPSGAGKSSVSRAVASQLGARYLDTGAMYRAVTWYMLRNGVDVTDVRAVAEQVRDAQVQPSVDPAAPGIHVSGIDVTEEIRSAEVTAAVSAVSAVPQVRSAMVALQRDIAAAGDIVVEGRDIGGVVLPHADVKVFLTADPALRAARRAQQEGSVAQAALEQMTRRDAADSTRSVSPLEQAPGAIVIDSTHMPFDEVVAAVIALVGHHD